MRSDRWRSYALASSPRVQTSQFLKQIITVARRRILVFSTCFCAYYVHDANTRKAARRLFASQKIVRLYKMNVVANAFYKGMR